jgi:hypothetical protein
MLSFIACYSMYVAIPLCALLFAVSPKNHVLSRRLPKIPFKLWIVATLIVLLAIDFAMIRLVNPTRCRL